jgi:hypothetical protein
MFTSRHIVVVCALFCGTSLFAQDNWNGFDYSDALVPPKEILWGGVPRDGIPAIHNPIFIEAAEADFLRDTDRVLGLTRNGVTKAYPIRIMDRHEIVNDRFGDEPIVVTYCPLCFSGMAFKATIGGEVRRFGVSGLLYNSDVLLYDYESDSLWSQIMSKAISGPMKGTDRLMFPVARENGAYKNKERVLDADGTELPSVIVYWFAWYAFHPSTIVFPG